MSPSSLCVTVPGSGVQGPSRGSTIRSVTIAATSARISDDAIMKKKFATIVIGWPPARAIASLAISVIIASVGVSEMFTMKIAATPANPDARPASGWRPTLANAAAARGIRIR